MIKPSDRKLRIPVRRIGKRWEVEFGGDIPVEEGQEAELLLPEAAITDRAFRKAMTRRSVIRILEKGKPLRAYLATKDFERVTKAQRKALLHWQDWKTEIAPMAIDNWSGGGLSFFELKIGPATVKQARDSELREGGLWLEIKGRKAQSLISSTFALPKCVSKSPATSLNHAFTILSEVYEPWRLSHTGSVYERFLYEETDGRWYPLWLLRDAGLAQNDQGIAKTLWEEFMKRMAAGNSAR